MKKYLLAVFLSLIPFSLLAEEPVASVTCGQGSSQYGNEIVFILSKNFKYGTLTIKRATAGADYTKDLSAFAGGKYRLDIAARGGITGYVLEYAAKDASEMQKIEAAISCQSAVAAPASTL